MTQTNAVDLGALLQHSNLALQATRRAGLDFGAALDQAQQTSRFQLADKPQEPVRQDNAPSDRQNAPSSDTQQTQRQDSAQTQQNAQKAPAKSEDSQAPAKPTNNADAHNAKTQTAGKSDSNQPSATNAKADANAKPDANAQADANAKANAKPDANAQKADPTANQPTTAAEAQAQAMLAVLVATPLVNTQAMQQQAIQTEATSQAVTATNNQPAQAAGQQAPAVQAQAAQAQATQAQLQALQQLGQQATPAAPANAQAQAQAQPQVQAQAAQNVPAFVQHASKDLGGIKIETATAVKPGAAVQVTHIEAKGPAANLITQLLDNLKQQETNGSTTQAQTLDGAQPTEMSAPLAVLMQTADQPPQQQAQDQGADPQNGQQLVPVLGPDNGPKSIDAKLAVAQQVEGPRGDEVLTQIVKQLDALKASQQNTLKLQLSPEHLGKIEIRVMSQQGVVSASITSDNQQVKGMLDNQLASLHQALADLGIKVDRVDVALNSAQLGQNGFGAAAQQQGQMFQQQQQANPGLMQAAGYRQWLADEPLEEAFAQYAPSEDLSAVNYVA